MTLGAHVRGARVVGVAREAARADPVAGERRIEHLAQPVQDHGLAHLRQHAAVHLRVVVGRARAGGERAARHQDDAAARGFDRGALLLVGGDHASSVHGRVGRQDDRCRRREKTTAPGIARASRDRAPDELERGRPVESHAALRGVHRFGDAEAVRPQVAAKGERRVPVDRRPRATDRSRRADRRRRARRRTRRDSSAGAARRGPGVTRRAA